MEEGDAKREASGPISASSSASPSICRTAAAPAPINTTPVAPLQFGYGHRRRSSGSLGGAGAGPPTPTGSIARTVSQSFHLSLDILRVLSMNEGLIFCQICREYETASETVRLSSCGHSFCRGTC